MEAIHILLETKTLYGLVPEIVKDEVVLRIRNTDADNNLKSYNSGNSPFSGDGASDRKPIVMINNTIVSAPNLGAIDKATWDSI